MGNVCGARVSDCMKWREGAIDEFPQFSRNLTGKKGDKDKGHV